MATNAKKAATNVRQPKDEHLNVRCTADQKALIERAASRDGVGASTWLLQQGLRAARGEVS